LRRYVYTYNIEVENMFMRRSYKNGEIYLVVRHEERVNLWHYSDLTIRSITFKRYITIIPNFKRIRMTIKILLISNRMISTTFLTNKTSYFIDSKK